jgi:hypothetical protein
MLASVRAFHAKHRFRETGGGDMAYRIALMAEELGDVSASVAKGRTKRSTAVPSIKACGLGPGWGQLPDTVSAEPRPRQ